jgi:hypothetical protein
LSDQPDHMVLFFHSVVTAVVAQRARALVSVRPTRTISTRPTLSAHLNEQILRSKEAQSYFY